MKRGLSVLFATILWFGNAMGEDVTLGDAQFAVERWLLTGRSMGCNELSDNRIVDVQTYEGKDGVGKFHVVALKNADGSNGGYVVTSAKTELSPILAYSENGEFIASSQNPLWVMLTYDVNAATAYVEQRKNLVANAGPGQAALTEDSSFSANKRRWAELLDKLLVSESRMSSAPSDLRVDKLLTTTWGQSGIYDNGSYVNCYNLYTPLNYVCGCVATAGAQIMYYHKWPTQSISATKDYSSTVGDYGAWSISLGYRTTSDESYTPWLPAFGGTYSWNTMSTATESGRQAIAKLTRDVGLSCYMKYGYGASSASYYVFPVRLLDQFGYANAKFIIRGSDEQYYNGMLASLDAKLPVGVSVPGHAIVADGYGYQGGLLYVHFNLGWSGSADAWYNPPDLTEADSDFTAINTVIYNIYPPSRAAADCTIVSGRVLDRSGTAISGSTVTARNKSSGTTVIATTDAKGIYALFLPAASYAVSAGKDGSTSTSTDLTVQACVSTSLNPNDERYYYSGTGEVHNMTGVDFTLGGSTPYPPSDDEYGLDADLVFTTGDSASWFKQTSITHDGVDAAQSGAIGNSDSTWLQTTVSLNATRTISFWWKVSSESGYDYLRFYVDGTQIDGISGEVDWTKMEYTLSSGEHTLKWVYSKDGSQSVGSDCGWVDQLRLESRIWTIRYHKNTGSGVDITRTQNHYPGQWQRLLYLDSQLCWSLKDEDGFSYTFLGWAKSPTGAPVYQNGQSVSDLVDSGKVMHLYAVWQKRAYNVVFHSNDERELAGTQEFRPGIAKNLLWLDSGLRWTRSGYNFLGWARSPTGGVVYANGASVQDLESQGGTLHLYAVWQARTWTVCFHKNDGSGLSTNESFVVGSAKNLYWLDSQLGWTRSDYNFLGWAKSSSGNVVYANGQSVADLAGVGKTLHLYAKWRSKTARYIVRFHKNDGTTEIADQPFKVGETKSLCWIDSDLQWSWTVGGYRCKFMGWARSSSGDIVYANGERVCNLADANATVHLYAVWRVLLSSGCMLNPHKLVPPGQSPDD